MIWCWCRKAAALILIAAFLPLVWPGLARAESPRTLLVGLVEEGGRPMVSWTRVVAGRSPARPAWADPGKGATLELLTAKGEVLSQSPIAFGRFMNVPMARPGSDDPPAPARIRVERPKAVIALPLDREATLVRVRREGEEGVVSMINPLDMAQGEAAPLEGRLVRLNAPGLQPEASEYTGPRINVVFMPSGFVEGESEKFEAAAWNFITALAGMEPFSDLPDALNYWTWEPSQNLGCESGCWGVERMICCDYETVMAQGLLAGIQSGVAMDEVIIIHNTAEYGGTSWTIEGDPGYKVDPLVSYCVGYSGLRADGSFDPLAVPVLLHEFGHSFGNLADEYMYLAGDPLNDFESVNCVADCGSWLQWDIPDECNSGCSWSETDKRPAPSIMLSIVHDTFNQASILSEQWPHGLLRRLQWFSCNYSPGQAELAVDAGSGAHSFSLPALHPDCGWIAVTEADWVVIDPNTGEGKGPGQVDFRVTQLPAGTGERRAVINLHRRYSVESGPAKYDPAEIRDIVTVVQR